MRYREMKNSGAEWIGEIPTHWKKSKIKYCATFMPTCDMSSLDDESKVTFTPMECIKNGFFENRDSTLKTIKGSYTQYQDGDIVVAKVTPCFENGNIAIMRNLYSGFGFGSSELFVLRPHSINTSFLFYSLQSNSFIQAGKASMTGTGGLKRVSSYTVVNYPIFLPPLAEQEGITAYLDEKCAAIDEIIEQAKATIEEYKAWKASVISEAVTKGLDHNAEMKDSGVEWIETMPKHWSCIPMKFMLNERNQKNDPVVTSERLSLSIDIGVTLYAEKTTNLDRFKEDVSQYKVAHAGDLVLNSMNMIVGAVGIAPVLGCVSPAYYVFYDNDKNHTVTRYCDYVFKNKRLRGCLFSLGQGIMAIDRGDGRINTCRLKVSRDDLGRIMLPCPPIEEQRRIISYLDKQCAAIDGIIAEKQTLIGELETYKKSLIFETVTGKWRVC